MDGGDSDAPQWPEVPPSMIRREGPVGGVPISMVVQNVDYGRLSREPGLVQAVNATIREAIALGAGPSILPGDVALGLLPGSVGVRAIVVPEHDMDLDNMRWHLMDSSSSLGESVADRLRAVEGIAAAQTGAIAVTNVSVSGAVIVGTPAPDTAAAGSAGDQQAGLLTWLLAPAVLLALCCCVPLLGFLLRRCGFKPGAHRSNQWSRQDAWYKPVTESDMQQRAFLPPEKAMETHRHMGARGSAAWPEVQRRPSFVSEAYGQPSLEAIAHGLPPWQSHPGRNPAWEATDVALHPGQESWQVSAEDDYLGRADLSPEDSYPPPPPPPPRRQQPHGGAFGPDEDLLGPPLDGAYRDAPLVDLSADGVHPRSDPSLRRSMAYMAPTGPAVGSDSLLAQPGRRVVAVEGAILRSSSPYGRAREAAPAVVRLASSFEVRPSRARSLSPSRAPMPVAVVEGGPMRRVGTRVDAPRRTSGMTGFVGTAPQPLPTVAAPAVLQTAPVPLQPLPLALPAAMQTMPAGMGRTTQVVSRVLQHPPQFADPSAASSGVPRATVGLDLNLNGRTDVLVTGPDLNLDGIPDVLQQHAPALASSRAAPGPGASSTGSVVDRMLRMS